MEAVVFQAFIFKMKYHFPTCFSKLLLDLKCPLSCHVRFLCNYHYFHVFVLKTHLLLLILSIYTYTNPLFVSTLPSSFRTFSVVVVIIHLEDWMEKLQK